MDYYSTLGLNKNASEQEIRKAYKKLSMKHHPDRGGDEEQFKKINEAYQTLSDPQKRSEYDNPQPQFRFDSGGMGGFEDIFAHAFGRGFAGGGPQRRVKNRDVQLRYTLDIADCFIGKGITLKYKLPSGKDEVIDVRIPPGCKNGDIVQVPNYGDDSIPNIPRGDLLLKITIRKSKDWDIDGVDLLHRINVSIFDLVTGIETKVKTPENRTINLKVPSGSQPGTTFSVQGYGLPDRSGRRGTLYVKVNGIVPKITDEQTLEKLKKIKNKFT